MKGLLLLAMIATAIMTAQGTEAVTKEGITVTLLENTNFCGGDIPCKSSYLICGDGLKADDIFTYYKDDRGKIRTDLTEKKILKDIKKELKEEECITYTLEAWKNELSNIDNIPVVDGTEFGEFTWWNSSFIRKRPISINVSDGSTLTDFQVTFSVPYDSDMQADFDDLRFTSNCDSDSIIPHYTESYTASTAALVTVRVPTINTTICMYYGNGAAASNSSGRDTYWLWDKFDDYTDYTTYWTRVNNSGSTGIATGNVYNSVPSCASGTCKEAIQSKQSQIGPNFNLTVQVKEAAIGYGTETFYIYVCDFFARGVDHTVDDITIGWSNETSINKDNTNYKPGLNLTHTIEMISNGSYTSFKWFNASMSLTMTNTTNTSAKGCQAGQGNVTLMGRMNTGWSASLPYWDNITVRNYHPTAPTATLGAEEVIMSPIINITSPTSGSTQNNGTITLIYTVTDNNNATVTTSIYSDDALQEANTDASGSTRTISINVINGQHTIKASAWDGSEYGNQSITVTVWVGINLTFFEYNTTSFSYQIKHIDGSWTYPNGSSTFTNTTNLTTTLYNAGESPPNIVVSVGDYQFITFENTLYKSVIENVVIFNVSTYENQIIKAYDGNVPIANAQIWVYNADGYLAYAGLTDSQGEMIATLPPAETYIITGEKSGYTDGETIFEMKPSELTDVAKVAMTGPSTIAKYTDISTSCSGKIATPGACSITITASEGYDATNITFYWMANETGGVHMTTCTSEPCTKTWTIDWTNQTIDIDIYIDTIYSGSARFELVTYDFEIGEMPEVTDEQSIIIILSMIMGAAIGRLANRFMQGGGIYAFSLFCAAVGTALSIMMIPITIAIILIAIKIAERLIPKG